MICRVVGTDRDLKSCGVIFSTPLSGEFVLTNIQKKSFDHNSEVYNISIWGLLQHISVHWDHLQVIHISKITKEIHCVMGIFYVNEISFVQIISLY